MVLIYPAILRPFSDKSGGYVVEFPDLPGCVTGGKTLEEAIMMGTDAASGWILDELEQGNQIPQPTNYYAVKAQSDEMVNLFVLDMDSYAEKYGQKSVRKNLTIPAWLNTFAEKNNINFSQVLQEALLKMTLTK